MHNEKIINVSIIFVYRMTLAKRQKNKRRRRQTGGFLSRYNFAYAGRDSVNQAAYHVKKVAPGLINQTVNRVGEQTRRVAPHLINQTSDRLDSIAQRRIRQAVLQSGQTMERIAPKIIRGTIEDFYKTPFRLLGSFGRRKLAQIKPRFVRRKRKNKR